MADTRAFVANVNVAGAGPDEHGDVNQSSPAWVLTFVRWENRNPFTVPSVDFIQVREPLVVENDCIQLSINHSKASLTPSLSAVLLMTDVNYETAVAPGDFVFVNVLNWPSDARTVAQKATSHKPINGVKDGFKGLFKVQGVRRTIRVDPNTGTRMVLFKIDGFAFTEFNNTIYFNNYLVDPNQDPKNQLLFASKIGTDWTNLVNKKGLTDVQEMIAVLIQSFIGAGINNKDTKPELVSSPNVHFLVPQLVGVLLGNANVVSAKDLYTYMFGIQSYSTSSNQSLSTGMNPLSAKKYPNFFFTTFGSCDGDTWLKPEYWNQIKTWAILNQYTNSPLNELYTCFRVSPTSESVVPTLVFRQMPFTNDSYKGLGKTTKFSNLPRWKLNPALIIDEDIGRDEAARVNFVQYFGKSGIDQKGFDIATEIAQGNIATDTKDVQRSGLRPYIVTSQFDIPTDNYKGFRSPTWAAIMGDALIGGHLKLNGTINCVGIVDPITVGDNLELDDVIYHIEQMSHVCSYNPQSGKTSFRTSLGLSNGIHISSNTSSVVYGEMSFPRAYDERLDDSGANQLLPGISESQDILGRSNIDTANQNITNSPFPGGQAKSRKK